MVLRNFTGQALLDKKSHCFAKEIHSKAEIKRMVFNLAEGHDNNYLARSAR